jgi:hypothetical protein
MSPIIEDFTEHQSATLCRTDLPCNEHAESTVNMSMKHSYRCKKLCTEEDYSSGRFSVAKHTPE